MKETSSYLLLPSLTLDKFFSSNIVKATIKETLVEEMSICDTGLQGNTEMEGPTRPKRVCPLKSNIL